MYKITTSIQARYDIQDAIDWENKRQPGLAAYFMQDLEVKIEVISKAPYINRVRYSNARCAITDIFPYLIHYIIDDHRQEVIITRVLHSSRKPIW